MEEKSWRSSHGREIMESNHGGEVMEGKSWRRDRGEETKRRNTLKKCHGNSTEAGPMFKPCHALDPEPDTSDAWNFLHCNLCNVFALLAPVQVLINERSLHSTGVFTPSWHMRSSFCCFDLTRTTGPPSANYLEP